MPICLYPGCGTFCNWINHLHLRVHGITIAEYQNMFPDQDLLECQTRDNISDGVWSHERTENHGKAIGNSKRGIPLTQNHKDSISKGLVEAYDNGKVIWNKGKNLSEDHKDNISSGIKIAASNGHPGCFQKGHIPSERAREAARLRCIQNPIAKGYRFTEEQRQHVSDGHKRAWSEGKYKNRKSNYHTKWELDVRDWFISRSIDFVYHPARDDVRFRFDFWLPSFTLLLELDGCYWHTCELCGNCNLLDSRVVKTVAKDIRKNKFVEDSSDLILLRVRECTFTLESFQLNLFNFLYNTAIINKVNWI